MSGTHGWLLGVGGLVESEVVPKNYPVVVTSLKRRKIKPKGGIADRKSRRSSGQNIVALDNPINSTSKELKLLQMEGNGDRHKGEISEWDHFPTSVQTTLQYLKLSGSERERTNRKAFTSVANIIEDLNEEKNDENNKDNNKGIHSLCNLQRIQSALNTNLSCD